MKIIPGYFRISRTPWANTANYQDASRCMGTVLDYRWIMKPEDFEEFIRKFLPSNVDPAELAKAAGLANDPQALSALMSQLQAAMSQLGNSSASVNWNAAKAQAIETAKQNSQPISGSVRLQLDESRKIAELWLVEATSLPASPGETKLLTRELWVADAINLFEQLAGPVADRMSVALSENLKNNLPEELSSIFGNASDLLRSAGSMLFAMQLGQALGKLSTEVMTGSDTGLPIIDRPALVVQNVLEQVKQLEVEQDQALLYLTVRELAAAKLFKQARWLRDSVTAQISRYAADIQIDNSAILDISENFDPENPEQLTAALESGAFIAERTEAQLAALENIEVTLALIEGWIEAVTNSATLRLPKQAAIAEAQRRRRAVGSPAEKTFATLVGLELRPRKIREATVLWQKIGEKLGIEGRDRLWEHPDLLPRAAAIDHPDQYLAGLDKPVADDFDEELKRLLEEN